mgnify:CR=1 FL=1
MQRADRVYVTESGETYHYTDDDCPVMSAAANGNRNIYWLTEWEALEQDYRLCKHCLRKYKRTPGNQIGCAGMVILAIGFVGVSVYLSIVFL